MNNILLSNANSNHTYIIKKINIEDKSLLQQLNNIGLTVGEEITLIKTNYGKKSFLVKVMNVNFAIDKQILDKVEVTHA